MLSKVLWCAAQSKHTGVLCGTRCMSSDNPSLEERLEEHFNKVMKNDNIPLFRNFDVYKSLLPSRFSHAEGAHCPLYKYPHWTCDSDLKYFASELENQHFIARAAVKYLTAPGGFGKTSCILPAFMKSTERKGGFTHYLYMTFHNNDNHYFVAEEKSIVGDEIGNLGASFIYECLQILLQKPDKEGPHKVRCYDGDAIQNKVNRCLQNIAGPDQETFRILLHLDEHRKMCNREPVNKNDETSKGALFSRGALTTLAYVPHVTVVATYTARPPLPVSVSSNVCRIPVGMPCLNVDAVVEAISELKFPQSPDDMEKDQKRMLATLNFRIGMKLTQCGLINFHNRHKDSSIATKELLNEFKICANDKNVTVTEALQNCINLCKVKVDGSTISNPNAAKLLLGMDEQEIELIERQVPNVVIVDGLMTCNLMGLLKLSDPKYPVYNTGCTWFLKMLDGNDYLAHTPLEAAYSWSLGCASAVHGYLRFDEFTFEIKCKSLLPARLFPQYDSNVYDLASMEHDVIYFVDESDGLTHPVCDIFFITKKGELVLIDITGGNDEKVQHKKAKLADWIEGHKDANFTGRGVVLAPCATGASKTRDCVAVVCGKNARKLLGGLGQVFRWLK